MPKKLTEYPKIDPTFKKKWLKALRSGEYKGTTGTLCKVSKSDPEKPLGYCCLGVAGAIAGVPTSQFNGKDFLYPGVTKGFTYKIPKQLLSKTNETNTELVSTLARMNDNKSGFKRIANWIEKNL